MIRIKRLKIKRKNAKHWAPMTKMIQAAGVVALAKVKVSDLKIDTGSEVFYLIFQF